MYDWNAETVAAHPNLRFQMADAAALPFRSEFTLAFSNAADRACSRRAPERE